MFKAVRFMSKRHPQNGPSLSRPPPKRAKPMTDKELADSHARNKAEQEEIERHAAKLKAFRQAIRRGGVYEAFPHLRPKKDN